MNEESQDQPTQVEAEAQNVDPFGASHDPFEFINQVMDGQSEDVTPPEPVQEAAPAQPGSMPKEDPSRYEHWQSKYDQAARELEQYQRMAPIVEKMNSDPKLGMQVLELVEQSLSGNGNSVSQPELAGAQGQVVESTPAPKEPEAPVRPPDYDETEAFGDPQSTSWRYRKAEEAYRQSMSDYRFQKLQHDLTSTLGTQVQTISQQLEQARAEQAQRAQLAQQYNHLVRDRGMSQDEAQDYLQFINNPKVEEDHLIQLYQIARGKAVQPAQQQTAQAPSQSRGLNPAQMPLPATTQSGQTADTRTVADKLMESMIESHRGTNPF